MEKKVISLIILLLSSQLVYCSLKTASRVTPRAIGALRTGAQVVKTPSLRAIRPLVTVPKKANFQSLAKPLVAQEKKSKDYDLKGLLPLGIISWVKSLFSTDQDKQKEEEQEELFFPEDLGDFITKKEQFKEQLLTEKLQNLDIDDFYRLLNNTENKQERDALARKYINQNWENLDIDDFYRLLNNTENKQERDALARKYINQNWENLDIDDFYRLLNNTENKQERDALARKYINQNWENLDIDDFYRLLNNTENKQERDALARKYINQNLEKLDIDDFYRLLNNTENKQEREELARKYINQNLEKLDINDFYRLLNNTENKQEREELAKKYINKNWEKLDGYVLDNLLMYIQNKQEQEELAKKYINKNWEKLDGSKFERVLNFVENKEKKEKFAKQYINQNIQNWKKLGIQTFNHLLEFIENKQEKDQLAKQYINQYGHQVRADYLSKLLDYIENKQERKRLEKELSMIPEEKSFSSQHLQDNFSELLVSDLRIAKPEMRELAFEMMDYQHEQEKKGNVVYFHGQNWGWKQYADLYKELYKIDHVLQDEYKFLRYTSNHIDTLEEERIAKEGVHRFAPGGQNLLFANRSLFANDAGSNTVSYVQSNVERFNDINMNKMGEIIFMQLGYEKEFDLLQKEHPELLERYNELHKKASQFGNFLVISMPQKIAGKISYSAISGGNRKGDYNQYEQGWLSYVKKHTIPAYHQYCIVLGETLLNPENAHKAGITIREYNAADPEIMAERDKVLAEIIELVKNYRNKL